ncbi:MAG: hypothetical protein IKB98_07995 [Clostridia bacterium]|nr:hypothetical protein [Clostridia bacterium]
MVLLAVDTIAFSTKYVTKAKLNIAKELNLPPESIFIHSTHIHTGPRAGFDNTLTDIEKEYNDMLLRKLVDSAKMAVEDLKPAKMGYAVSQAKKVAFNRRYLMKDGSFKTNPGVNNPDIVKSAGLMDESVNVLRFNRECGDNIVLINFGNHPDCIGGNKISADWPGFTRRIFEKTFDETKCLLFNGAEGDINHVNVAPKGGDFNDMFNDFDDVSRGYGHSRHIGNVMAASAMQVYDKVEYVDVDNIKYTQKFISIPSNMPNPDEMEEAYYIKKMHDEGRDSELPYKGMYLTTMVAGASRKIQLEHGPDSFPLLLSVITIGKVALVGIPGEPFCGIGLGIKESKNYDMICPCCLTNGDEGYFPMKDSFDEGGYESQAYLFKSGVAEIIIEEGLKLLDDLRN